MQTAIYGWLSDGRPHCGPSSVSGFWKSTSMAAFTLHKKYNQAKHYLRFWAMSLICCTITLAVFEYFHPVKCATFAVKFPFSAAFVSRIIAFHR